MRTLVHVVGTALTYSKFCYMCQNGGDTLACDRCARVVCYEHMPVLRTLSEEVIGSLEYLCPACHIVDDRRASRLRPYEVSYCPHYHDISTNLWVGPLSLCEWSTRALLP